MISYNTWRLLNESLGSGLNLGIKSVPAVGGIVSQHGDGTYYEMKKKMLLDDPEAMDDESDVPMDDDEDMHMHHHDDHDMDDDEMSDMDDEDMDDMDMDSDEDMDDDEMSDMGDEDMDDMDMDSDEDMDDDKMSDMGDEDMDMDEMPPPRRKPMPPMGESKKYCGMNMKGMKKKCGMGMVPHDHDEEGMDVPPRVKKVTIIKQEHNDFINSICKQVKGDHKRFQEDAIYAPPNDNAGLAQPGEVGYAPVGRIGDDSQKELGNSNDFGYSQLPTLEQFAEWKKMEADGGDNKKMYSMLKRCIKKGMDFDACKAHCKKHGHKITKSDFNKCKKMVD